MEEQVKEEKKKFSIESWIKDKYNLTFLIIIIAAFVIRLIFFIKTMNQPIWWDEGEYLSMAKSFATGIYFNFNPQRPFLYPLFVAFLYLFKASEPIVRFITVLLPSLGAVIVSYFLGKDLYNKKTALIFTSIMAVFWVSLFNTTRLHTDMLALLFGLLSLWIFWKFYVKEYKPKMLWLLGLFLALGFMTRIQNALIGVTIFVYLALTERHKLLLKKGLWIALIVMLICLIPLFAWNIAKFDNILAQTAGTAGPLRAGESPPVAWNVWNIFPLYLMPNNNLLGIISFVFLLIGLITFVNLFVGIDMVLKNKNQNLNSDLFTMVLFFVTILYFMLIERPSLYGYDPKWLFFAGLAMFLIISKGFVQLGEWIKKIPKSLVILIIASLLILSLIPQFTQSNSSIESRKDSYLQVKEAALWVKSNSNQDEIIYTQSPTQTTYYAERYSKGIPATYEEFVEQQKEDNSRFFIISTFEKHPDWVYLEVEQKKEEFIPVQAYMANENQPLLVIYQYNPKLNS